MLLPRICSCACHRDAAKRHGPYFEWTYKLQGKTVNVKLSPQAAPLYQAATKRHRKLKAALAQDGAPVANRVSSFGQANCQSRLRLGFDHRYHRLLTRLQRHRVVYLTSSPSLALTALVRLVGWMKNPG